MNIHQTLNGNELTVGLEGSLDTMTSPDLQKVLEETMDSIDALILDFEKLSYVSSAGLRVMMSATKFMAKKGGMMKIIHVNDEIMDTLEITGLADLMNVER